MRRRLPALWWAALLAVGCDGGSRDTDTIAAAESVLDAFYAWDAERLRALLLPGVDADNLLYYQGWAEAANYAVQERRPCRTDGTRQVVCAVTVTDDFGRAFGYTATDTFTMTVESGKVASVAFAGDDPPIFDELFDWLSATRPQVLTGPCKDLFSGGTTPGDCARAVARAAREFAALQAADPNS